jgi:aminomethyltransferase
VRTFGPSPEPEYHAIRHAAGVLDVSPLKKYAVTGRDAAAFLSFVFARDVGRLRPGRVTYACFCDENGHVIDDGTVTRRGADDFRVTTASPSLGWFASKARGFSVSMDDVSDRLAALAVQGPQSRALLEDVTGERDLDIPFFGFRTASVDGHDVEITRTGYTGDLGYELWLSEEAAVPVWDRLQEAGRGRGLLPVGLDALDITRIEAGFILQDVDYLSALRTPLVRRRSTPFEIGLGWTVHLDRDPFLGQDALLLAADRPRWQLVGLEIDWDELRDLYDAVGLPPHLPTEAWRTPRPVHAGPRQVGQATSGTWSPLLKRNLALASVESRYASIGTRLRIEHTVDFHRHAVTATVVDRPFFDHERTRS